MRMIVVTAAALLSICLAAAASAAPLPLPEPRIPESPLYPSSVVTAGGQRLLLSYTDVVVSYNARARRLETNHPGWWIINYPLGRIRGLEGKSEDAIAQLLFGKPAAEVRNWYVQTPGTPTAEPPQPDGPAPIVPTPNPRWVVNGALPAASDDNPGTAAKPLKTIAAAVKRAVPGDTIHVYPAIYREGFAFERGGTAERPIRLEGIRGKSGQMPIISGNDLFPTNAWQPVAALPGVYRADLFTHFYGNVSADEQTLVERSWPAELKPGEFCLNRASHEYLAPLADGKAEPREGEALGAAKWRRVAVDEKGFLSLGPEGGNSVWYASTWVWVAPSAVAPGVVWDPRFPQPITGNVGCDGAFRAFRMTGADETAQVNQYRMWVNGAALPAAFVPGQPRAYHDYGFSDSWTNFQLREGWNHLVFAFDTTTRPKDLAFRFGVPEGVKGVACSATKPADLGKAPEGKGADHISECMLAGPFPAMPDRGVYVRLPGDRDPNGVVMDLAARGELVSLKAPFVQVRGFEFRHGGQFQQRAQVLLKAEGTLLEGCLLRDSEVRGVTADYSEPMDQTSAPIVVRGNWVLNPGGVGIGGSGGGEKLTAENQNTTAPGRGRLLAEYNVVTNNNCRGYERWWESGGFKVFRMTGCVIRNNTIVGGDGPAIWLDWEHFNNRIEGNLALDGIGFCVGVEASPGPNLLANNLAVNLRPGGVWFREGFLSWSCRGTWAVHNTVDGRWNPTDAHWFNQTGADGIYLDEGGDDRGTLWGKLPRRDQGIVNNLIVGCHKDVQLNYKDDVVAGNMSDTTPGKQPDAKGMPPAFRGAEHLDYRLPPGNPAANGGAENPLAQLVTHDYFGLLRFPGEPRAVGAFRVDAPVKPGALALVEVEYANGEMRRLHPTAGPEMTGK